MNTSSGLKLSLRWRSKSAETENQLDTNELVELLKKDSKMMKEEEFEKLSKHFRSKMFRLMVEFEFNFIINSQVLWGDCDTLDSLAIYQLIRLENVKFVTVMAYIWNGIKKISVSKIGDKIE